MKQRKFRQTNGYLDDFESRKLHIVQYIAILLMRIIFIKNIREIFIRKKENANNFINQKSINRIVKEFIYSNY